MNRIMSIIPVRGGWCVQIVRPNGELRWVPCAGSFRAAIDQALRWEPEEVQVKESTAQGMMKGGNNT